MGMAYRDMTFAEQEMASGKFPDPKEEDLMAHSAQLWQKMMYKDAPATAMVHDKGASGPAAPEDNTTLVVNTDVTHAWARSSVRIVTLRLRSNIS